MDGDPRTSNRREPQTVVLQQSQHLSTMPLVREILDATPGILLVLNDCRQVVFANRSLATLLGLSNVEEAYGLRPGELLCCEHIDECGGCGMGEACTTCGAAKAIATCERNGASTVQECRILNKCTGRALDLRVSATPLSVAGLSFTLLSLTDIGHEKRRQAMERLFFHDLLNTAGALIGYVDLLAIAPPSEHPNITSSLKRMAHTLAEEIHAHRQLAAAESGDLTVHWRPLSSHDLLRGVLEIYRSHEAARDRIITIDHHAASVTFTSDRILLTRVLGNLVKNALEATLPGQTITLGCKASDHSVEFWVHNPGAMPRDVQLQVFQRSFSTKGIGRGLGTYSIKLLTERYLNGTVSFTSSPQTGTTFTIRYPRSHRPY